MLLFLNINILIFLPCIAGGIHSVAEALLLLLESTAEPLIPYNLHNVCLSAATNYFQCKQVNRINSSNWIINKISQFRSLYCFVHSQIVMQLPETRRTVFLYISSFLQELLNHTQDNELDAKTLGSHIFYLYLSITLLLYSHFHNVWLLYYLQLHYLDQYF